MDVSYSMKVNMEERVDKEDNWLRSIFAGSLLEHNETSKDN